MKKRTSLLFASLLVAGGAMADGVDVTATYITNPGFEDCAVVENNEKGAADIHTDYSTELGTDYSANGWKLVAQAKSANGGAIAYASDLKVQYSKWNVAGDAGPAAGPAGTTGTKGLCFAGNASVVYQQAEAVTLPAGSYTLTVNVWARNGETSNPKPQQQVVNIKTGFLPEGGSDDDLIPAVRKSVQFTSNGWDKEELTIELTQATTGRFQLSYGSSYFVVIDDLKLEYAGAVVTTALNAVITKAKALNNTLGNSTLAAAIQDAENFIANPTTQEDVTTQVETLYGAMATALTAVTEPVDITEAYLENASFETGKIEPWAWGSKEGSIGEPTNSDSNPFIDGVNVVEFAQSASNSLYQNINYLPAGYYIIDAKLNQKAYLKVGENRTQLQGGKEALFLRVHPASPYNLTAGEELTVSASSTASFRVDNFRLFYGKDESSLLARLLQDVKADAQAILDMTQFNIITGSERSNLQTAIEGADADAINTAANAFVASKDSYNKFAKAKEAAADYTKEVYPYASAAIYNQIQSLLATDATSADNAIELKEQLDNACFQMYVSNAYCEGVDGVIDYTANIIAANATGTAVAAEWTKDNMEIRTDKTAWTNPKTSEDDQAVYGVTSDYYRTSKEKASLMYQTISGLPKGTYVLSVVYMSSASVKPEVLINDEKVGDLVGVGTYSGGRYGGGWVENVITFEKADDSDLKLTLQYTGTANYQDWYFDNLRLFLLPGNDTPGLEKCATPTIDFVDGKLKFSCDTDGVEFVSTVTATEAKEYNSDEVEIVGTYTVSVYATKEGFVNSDVATREFSVGFNGNICDVNRDGAVDVADIATVIDEMAK